MSKARKAFAGVAAIIALLAAGLAPASAAARHRSGQGRVSAHASQRYHSSHLCSKALNTGGTSATRVSRPRGCVRDSHSSRPKVRGRKRNSHAPAKPKRSSGATRAASRAASIAAVLAAPCQSTEIAPEAGNMGAVHAAVLCLINHVRAQHGELPLATNPRLERAAQEHAQELVSLDYFAHVSPSGETPVARIRATGYIPGPSFGYVIGENLAWGTLSLSTPQQIVSAWVASPGHLANILEAQYQDTGLGIVAAAPPSLGEGVQGATYAQEFGVIVG